MNRRSVLIFLAVLALVGASAGFLQHHHGRQRLGRPGVRLVPEILYGVDRSDPATNRTFVAATNLIFLPPRVLDYESWSMPVDRVVLETLPADTSYADRLYKGAGDFYLSCKVVLMGVDRTSIHKPQYCLAGSGLSIDSSELTSVRIQRPYEYDLPVMRLNLSGEGRTAEGKAVKRYGVFVYWFVADGEVTAAHEARMWSMARQMVRTGELQRWAYVICLAESVAGQEDATFERMKKFIASAVPEFQTAPGGANVPGVRSASARP